MKSTLESLGELARLKPTGQGNPPVQFLRAQLAHQRPLQAHRRGQAARKNVGDGWRRHARSALVERRQRIVAGREIDLAFCGRR